MRTALCVFVMVFIAACSSDGESRDSLAKKAQAKDASGIEALSKLLIRGIISADGQELYGYLSESCRQETSAEEIASDLKTGQLYLKTRIGASFDDFSLEKVETRNIIEGSTGQARFTLHVNGKSREVLKKYFAARSEPTGERLPLEEPTEWFAFEYEDSRWVLSGCRELLSGSTLLSTLRS